MERKHLTLLALIGVALLAGPALYAGHHEKLASGELCQGYGPQSPRDIESMAGDNARRFSFAPPSDEMNLCNIHFHKHAEHKASAYSIAGDGAGYRCAMGANMDNGDGPRVCDGVGVGDTIEIHWVYSSCDVAPGAGLGSCLSESCANPDLRVEAQVFVVSDADSALDFEDFDAGEVRNGYHQPRALPTGTGDPVTYHGSTTGPSYDESKCSPLQVTWSVRPECATVAIDSLGEWCESNAFDENSAHGVRQLVTAPDLLSEIETE